MTLILTLIRPEGVWQSADNRVSRNGVAVNDAAPKQLHIVFPPDQTGPKALIAFTGLAELSDGTPTLQWVRETLRGETRSIMESLGHLRDRLTRDVGHSKAWGTPLVLTGGIFEGDKRFYAEIRNIDPNTRSVIRAFDYAVVEVNEPMVFMGGSGATSISKADVRLLLTQAKLRPANWDDHLGLLAAVNRRTASRDKSVSPWCQASYLSTGSEGAKSKRFAKPGEPDGPPGMQTLLFGIDLHGMSVEMEERMQMLKAGMNPDELPIDEEAAQRSLDGRP